MTHTIPSRAAFLSAVLARHYPDAPPHRVAQIVTDMQTAARKAKRRSLTICNSDLTEEQVARLHALDGAAANAINLRLADAILAPDPARNPNSFPKVDHPARISLGGDPRGACGEIIIPGMRADGFGDGFAIY